MGGKDHNRQQNMAGDEKGNVEAMTLTSVLRRLGVKGDVHCGAA